MSQTYLFQLGRTADLSVLELTSLLGKDQVSRITPQFVVAQLDSDEVAKQLFARLGGCLKVLKQVGSFQDLSTQTITEYLAAFLADFPRPTFALAESGRDSQEKLSVSDVKKILKNRGVASRFIEGPRGGLSASVLLHQEVVEVSVIQIGSEVRLAQTLNVQDIDDWTKRDRFKPYADRKKGMLPPKVARIMVNIGLGHTDSTQTDHKIRLLDPFCGSGTVLMEALTLGCHVIGSDLDKNAVQGAQTNLDWFVGEYDLDGAYEIFYADASSIRADQLGGSVDLIITEPFLGKPAPQPTALMNIFKGLEKLYIGVFKNWTKILKPGSKVVIVFPVASLETAGKENTTTSQFSGRTISLEKMIDKLQGFGYTPLSEPVKYFRPQAVIQRQIWIFQYR